MRYLFFFLVHIVLVMLLAGCHTVTSSSLSPCLSLNAVTSTASYETVQNDLYEDAAGRIRFQPEKFGQIRLFLPIFNSTGQLTNNVKWDRLRVLYLDSDGQLDAGEVKVTLTYLAEDGSTPTVVDFSSNDSSQSSINSVSVPFSHSFDFTRRYYYLDIRLRRNNQNTHPWIGGVSLCEQFQ